MTLTPLLAADPIIIVHAFAAMGALVVTLLLLIPRRGQRWHRRLGYGWLALMATTALTSFWINDIRLFGPFSPIHLLSILALVSMVSGWRAARMGKIKAHRTTMRSLVFFALVVTGGFTLLPGRIMHDVVLAGLWP